ncbi:acyltransferase [Pedobacter boryungensis]|uniref:acyltransferase n=1 Tax=Pedobacter boryungensis TaxID=869962 RepID=UPI001C20BE30|nr:acyltransferase [Pedobacter boryungensis]
MKPLLITKKCVSIGNDVYIWPNCRIEGIFSYAGTSYSPQIMFDARCSIQQNLHLTCAESVYIGKNTAIAANVSITDIHHGYEDIEVPIEEQSLIVMPVYIGDDCKINNNAVILPGTSIGKHCIIGANSVVKGSFPNYCVIVGAPAKIVKRYCEDVKQWRSTHSDGSFKDGI